METTTGTIVVGGEEEAETDKGGVAGPEHCGGGEKTVVEDGRGLVAINKGEKGVWRLGGAVLGPGSYWP